MSTAQPGYVFIGDDFTGASDTLATIAERGLNVRLFLDEPTETETSGLEAVGIATDLRARSPEEIASHLRSLAPFLRTLPAGFTHYKVCSTFDSAPHVGSIGAAVETLEAELSPTHTVILGGQPSLGRYCLFGNLFARAPDGEVCRIDRHPIMSRHPVTPMGEADLRVHLKLQGLDGPELLDRSRLRGDPAQLDERFSRPGRTLVDAVDMSDIERLGDLMRGIAAKDARLLIVGASSVAEAIFFRRAALTTPQEPDATAPRVSGPRLAIAGSRSSATAAQVAAAMSYERLPLARIDLGEDGSRRVRQCASLLASGRNVLVYLRPDLDYGLSADALSGRLAELAATIVGMHRPSAIAIAGGDTSSALVKRLGFRSLSFVSRAGAGVAICRGHAAGSPLDDMLLLLKGGQVGGPDVLERFARM